MELTFEANVVLTVNHNPIEDETKHVSTKFNLGMHKPLVKEKYVDEEGNLNKDGSFALSNVLVQGLIANLHMAHDLGFRNSAEHIRWIISELERGFSEVTKVEQTFYGDRNGRRE